MKARFDEMQDGAGAVREHYRGHLLGAKRPR